MFNVTKITWKLVVIVLIVKQQNNDLIRHALDDVRCIVSALNIFYAAPYYGVKRIHLLRRTTVLADICITEKFIGILYP